MLPWSSYLTRYAAARPVQARVSWVEMVVAVVAMGVWKYTGAVARCVPPRRRPDHLCDVGPATPAIELEGDQLGDLGRDVCHRRFCSAQAASRAEQGANFAKSFIRRVLHDGNE